VRIISRKHLKDFWLKHPQAEQPLKSWYKEAESSSWQTPMDVKNLYRTLDIIKGNRLIFNISGNKYRLIIKVNYDYSIIYIRFIGTHAEYDRINAEQYNI
jgi:mRNA interferase HigB